MGIWGIRSLKTRVGPECSISKGEPDCTVEVYMLEGVTVLRVGTRQGTGSSRSESCQEF